MCKLREVKLITTITFQIYDFYRNNDTPNNKFNQIKQGKFFNSTIYKKSESLQQCEIYKNYENKALWLITQPVADPDRSGDGGAHAGS